MKLDDMRLILTAWDNWAATDEGEHAAQFTALVGREDASLNRQLKERLFQAFCAGFDYYKDPTYPSNHSEEEPNDGK